MLQNIALHASNGPKLLLLGIESRAQLLVLGPVPCLSSDVLLRRGQS